MSRNIDKRIITAVAAFLFSALFLLLFASISSPLSAEVGIDYDMFVMGGDALLRGELYTGFFDNKGPYLFAINALGLLVSQSKWGLFLLESVNLTIVILLLVAIGKSLHASSRQLCCALLFTMVMLTFTINYGNSVEMWTLPWVLAPLWCTLRRCRRWYLPLFYGICFGVVAMMRLNCAAIIVGVVLFDILEMLHRREFSRLFKYLALAFCGVIAGVMPAIVYFALKGSIWEMLDATFIYNLRYWHYHPPHGRRGLLMNLSFMLGVFIAPLFAAKSSRRVFILVSLMSVMTLLAIGFNWSLIHYYNMVVPFYFLMAVLGLNQGRRVLTIVSMAVVVVPFILARGYVWERPRHVVSDLVSGRTYLSGVYESPYSRRIFQSIPAGSTIYQYELPRELWSLSFRAGANRVGRYTSQQLMVSGVRADSARSVIADFQDVSPQYIIAGKPLERSPLAPLTGDYICVDTVSINSAYPILIYRRSSL